MNTKQLLLKQLHDATRMPFSDEVWRKGFGPDIRVALTVEDIIRDEDRALPTALRHLRRGGVQ